MGGEAMFTATLSVRSLFFVLALADLVLLAATVAGAADPDTVTVNTEDDYIPWLPNDPKISLRSALNLANKSEEIDKIILPAGTYTLTIVGSGDDTNSAGDLDILDSVTITGAGPDKTIIDGNASDRVFDIRPSFKPEGIAVVLNNLTIQNGKVTPTMAQDSGGGIRNRENLTLNNVVVRNNNAVGNDSSNVVGGGDTQWRYADDGAVHRCRQPGSSRRRAFYRQCHHDQAKPDRRKPGHVRQRHTGLWRPAP